MLVGLGVVEQRYRAVLEVLDGAAVSEVARRYGVARQTLHSWLRRYAAEGGIANLADRSCRPDWCPHQMPAVVEARVLAIRAEHPGWGPARIGHQLVRDGVDPVPGRSSIYRCLVRHRVIDPTKRRRRRADYRRWERGRSMELWQMDVMGRVLLADGSEVKVVTGIDDHSRFVVCAAVVARATARPVCAALSAALARHGVPEQILTDNGKVFTARFGLGPGPVMFDRICAENGIRHLLTAPYSPTTTGKVERLHKTMRAEFFNDHQREFTGIAALPDALDGWVAEYNTERPHQSVGGRPPVERFALAQRAIAAAPDTAVDEQSAVPVARQRTDRPRPAGVSRWVNARGRISLAGFAYPVGATFAGEPVEVVVDAGLVQILHAGVLVATHAQRARPDQAEGASRASRPRRVPVQRRARDATAGVTVTRLVDRNGAVSFAGAMYRAGRSWRGQSLQVAVVAGSVQIAKDGQVIRVHPIRHDRAKELGAFANPRGRPRRRRDPAGASGPPVVGAEQGLAVVGAEQEPEPGQVGAQPGQVVALGAEEAGQ
jgi:transposase InsO family protein